MNYNPLYNESNGFSIMRSENRGSPAHVPQMTSTQGDLTIKSTLQFYAFHEGQWINGAFNEDKRCVRIGRAENECDITIPESAKVADIQLVIQFVDRKWYAVESAAGRKCSFNGVKKRQTVIGENSTVILNIGSAKMIFATVKESKYSVFGPGDNPEKKYKVLTANGDELSFSGDRPVLIGSHKLCALKTRYDDPFTGVIFSYGKKLFCTASDSKTVLLVDNVQATTPTPLNHGSVIQFGKEFYTISLSDELQKKSVGFNTIPEYNDSRLCLLEINNGGLGDSKLILPASGRSVFAGRGPENYIVLNSSKVSRRHAQVSIYDSSIMLADCNSSNGTYLNNKKVLKAVARPGDIVDFGDKRFLLCYSE